MAVSGGHSWGFWIRAWIHFHRGLTFGKVQCSTWVPRVSVPRQAVEAASLIRTWLGNWHRVTSTLFLWSKHSQSPPTPKGRGHRAHLFVGGVPKDLWLCLNQHRGHFFLFPFSLFPIIILFLLLNNDKNVWNYYSGPDILLSVSATHEGEGTITYSQEKLYFLYSLPLERKSHSLCMITYISQANYLGWMLQGTLGSLRPTCVQ